MYNSVIKGESILSQKVTEITGEFLRKEQRVKIEEFFSARVIDRYGLAESGIVAYQMPKQENLSVIDFHTFV